MKPESKGQQAPQKLAERISQQNSVKSPQSSSKFSKKALDLKRLQSIHENTNIDLGGFKAFVVGFSGGDCAGKKQMITYLFKQSESGWKMQDSNDQVCILHQDYFYDLQGNHFSAQGTDWGEFYKTALSLSIGNEATIFSKKHNKEVKLKPAKLLVIEGSHIFMEIPKTKPLFDLINIKIFIDSDSDIRLSRRIFRDTQDSNISLQKSIHNYLENIKPSYQKQVEPTKVKSDIILPHFGGGYDDHKKKERFNNESNIKNAGALIMAHVKEQMNSYEREEVEVQDVF